MFCTRRCVIKLIETVINRFKLEEVRIALNEIGVEDFKEIDVITLGHQKRQVKISRGARFVANLFERVKLQIVAADDSVGKIVEAIGSIARTERKENCRIAIRPY
ncbi:MAG: P-II family nitrogen regulator [Desulfuromonadales bacterium]|nr:P-II family nitrogen regulator [Desulfuromonadales bacterium]